MELCLSPALTIFSFVVTLLISICFYSQLRKPRKVLNFPPEAAGGWPIIGHLSLLSGPKLPHIILSNMADEYGPIFSIRLGSHHGLIVNTPEIAKEIFTTNDMAFSLRPNTTAIQLMSYNFAMFSFSPSIPYWRRLRKIVTTKLLSSQKVSMLKDVREVEVMKMMKSIHESCTVNNKNCLDMKKCFRDLTLNLIVRIVAGRVGEKKMDVGVREKWTEVVEEFVKMMGVLTLSDVVPFLKWSDRFGGIQEELKKTGKATDSLLQTWLDEHKKIYKKSSCDITDDEKEEDFMVEMMSVADSIAEEFPKYDADTINKATCQSMMIGGTDTLTVTLTWALSLLLNNPHTLKIAQQELDKHIPQSRHVQDSDIQKLVYIQAIIKETLRLQPPVPIIPRQCNADCTLATYHIPAGTRLFVNTWKIHRDPRLWPDPLEFMPERFITNDRNLINVRGQNFEFLPFGGGRMVCPGISYALQATHLALASILHGFDVTTLSNEPIDMTGSFGTVNMKATPLDVVLKPRLSPQLYV